MGYDRIKVPINSSHEISNFVLMSKTWRTINMVLFGALSLLANGYTCGNLYSRLNFCFHQGKMDS